MSSESQLQHGIVHANSELYPAKSVVVCMLMINQLVSTLHYILLWNYQKGMKLHISFFFTNHHFSSAKFKRNEMTKTRWITGNMFWVTLDS